MLKVFTLSNAVFDNWWFLFDAEIIILNNNSHESVGGQLTNAAGIDFKKLSTSVGYKNFFRIRNKKNLKEILKKFIKSKGPSLLEVKINNGTLKNLSRPKNLVKIKENFMVN